MKLLKRLWSDEAGFVVSAELVLVASVAVLAMIVGLSAARDGINSELADVADAWQELSQSYEISHIIGHSAAVNGTEYLDNTDFCATPGTNDGTASVDEACITHTTAAGANENSGGQNPTNT